MISDEEYKKLLKDYIQNKYKYDLNFTLNNFISTKNNNVNIINKSILLLFAICLNLSKIYI